MPPRPTLTKKDQPTTETAKGQSRPKEERYLLRVDGQTKRSFSSKETALGDGTKIKSAFPVVMVSVVDTEDGSVEIVKP